MRDDVSIVEEHIMLAGRELVMMTKHVIKPHELHEVFVIGGDAPRVFSEVALGRGDR